MLSELVIRVELGFLRPLIDRRLFAEALTMYSFLVNRHNLFSDFAPNCVSAILF